MQKLLKGILDFRRHSLAQYREKFASLARGQKPDALMIACSDSRVVPNVFASSDPGDLLVVRNVGNLIPCYDGDGLHSDSEAAAIEFALTALNISDLIVCGHSECGAMETINEGRERVTTPNLREWLKHGEPSLRRLKSMDSARPSVNELSKANVLQQMEHVRSYPVVQDRLKNNQVRIHGWWFELSTANVFFYNEKTRRFELIREPGLESKDLPATART